MKITALFAAAGHALMTGAEHFEASLAQNGAPSTAQGSTGTLTSDIQSVEADVLKGVSDAKASALSLIKGGATNEATQVLTTALTPVLKSSILAQTAAAALVDGGESLLATA